MEINPLDVIGLFGTVGLLLFYWLLSKQQVMKAYVFGTAGAALWMIVGIATPLYSLIFMECAVIAMNIKGMRDWRHKKIVDSD